MSKLNKSTIKKIQRKNNSIKIRFNDGGNILIKAREGVICSFERFSGNHRELNRKQFESLQIQTDCQTINRGDETVTMGYNHVLLNGGTENELLMVFKVESASSEFYNMHLMLDIIDSEKSE